jgi:hypothetical protein
MAFWIIEVDFDGRSWRTVPDPAIVARQDLVAWRFRGPSSIEWSVYFPEKTPFHNGRELTADYGGTTAALPTEEEGEYKYEVRAKDATSKKEIGKDDPKLIVMP